MLPNHAQMLTFFHSNIDLTTITNTMGNENSATTEKNSNATTRSGYKRTTVPGPLHPNYQPPVANDNRNNNSAIQSKVVGDKLKTIYLKRSLLF